MHIVKTKGVRREAANLGGMVPVDALGLSGKPVFANIVRQVGGQGRSDIEGSGGIGAAGIFPLGLRWQPVGPPGFLLQLLAKSTGIFPRNPVDRQFWA